MYFQVQEKLRSFLFCGSFLFAWIRNQSGSGSEQYREPSKTYLQQNSFLTFFPDPLISSKPTKSVIRYGSVADLSDLYRMFLGLLDPDPDPVVRGPDPSFIKQKTLIPTFL